MASPGHGGLEAGEEGLHQVDMPRAMTTAKLLDIIQEALDITKEG